MKAKDKLQYCGYSVSTGLKIWNDQTDLLMYFQRNQQEYSVTEVKSISQACYIYIYTFWNDLSLCGKVWATKSIIFSYD